MLISTSVIPDVLTLPTNFAKIISISDNVAGSRDVEYEFDILVDTSTAIVNDAFILGVAILSSQPPIPSFTPTAFSPTSFRTSTRNLEISSQAVRSLRDELTLVSINTDITSDISNSTARKMGSATLPTPTGPWSAGIDGGSTIASLASPRTQEILTVSSSAPVSAVRFSLPFSHYSIAPTIQMGLGSFSESLIQSTIDPAALSPSLLSSIPQPTAEAAQSMMYTPSITAVQPKAFQVQTDIKRITRRISVSETSLTGYPSFVLKLTLKNNYKIEVAEMTEVVNHSRLLNEFLTPKIAPELNASQVANGNISLGAKQIDPMAKKIHIYRRLAPSLDSSQSTSLSLLGSSYSWTKIVDTDLDYNDGELRFVDNISTSSPLMYRATSIGENSKAAEKFASKIILPRQEVVVIGGTSGCAIPKYDYASKTATIIVSDLPKKVISVGLRRYDLTFNSYANKQAGTGPGFKWVGETVAEQMIFVGGTDEAQFKDPTVKFGMTYKYVPVMILRRGNEEVGRPGILEIPLSPSDDEKVSLEMGTPTILESGTGRSVSFSVGGEFTDFGFEEIAGLLDAGGQESLFADQVSENRGQFASLLSFVVERENLSTGQVETFGAQSAGTFTDNPSTRASANVSDIELGTRYSYSATVAVNPAETLIDTLETNEIDQQTLQAFTRSVSKFRGPQQLRRSTLKSTQAQSDYTVPSRIASTDPIQAGLTTVSASSQLTIPSSTSTASSITLEERSDNVTLSWIYSGDVATIDHFQLYVTSDGGRELIGTLHNDSTTTDYSYRHFTEGFSQNYSYEVVPIGLDFEEKSAITSQTVAPKLLSSLSTTQFKAATVIQK